MTLVTTPALNAAAPAKSFLDTIDDIMEKAEPGYKARRAAEKLAEGVKEGEERAALLAQYGSEEAVLAPIEEEAALEAALAPWKIIKSSTSGDGSTYSWDAYGDTNDPENAVTAGLDAKTHLPAGLLKALTEALPFPKTLSEAAAEVAFWKKRDDNCGLAMLRPVEDRRFGLTYKGADNLRLSAKLRLDLISLYLEKDGPVITPSDLLARINAMASWETALDGYDIETLQRSARELDGRDPDDETTYASIDEFFIKTEGPLKASRRSPKEKAEFEAKVQALLTQSH